MNFVIQTIWLENFGQNNDTKIYWNDDWWKNNVIDGSWDHDVITDCKNNFTEVCNVNLWKVQIKETVTYAFLKKGAAISESCLFGAWILKLETLMSTYSAWHRQNKFSLPSFPASVNVQKFWSILHGYFSRFLNCTNGTKSRNASQIGIKATFSPSRIKNVLVIDQ